jgi:SAM-dependent methyltransferase
MMQRIRFAIFKLIRRLLSRRGYTIIAQDQLPRIRVNYQDQRHPHEKFDLLWDALQAHVNTPSSLLDIGCNQGIITNAFAARGVFAVGIDGISEVSEVWSFDNGACFGVQNIEQDTIDKLPVFDVILLLSVHHQWYQGFGEEACAQRIAALMEKAKSAMVIEFAAIAAKYAIPQGKFFVDNDEASVIVWAEAWLHRVLPGFEVLYIGKNCEQPPEEPYRYTFLIKR